MKPFSQRWPSWRNSSEAQFPWETVRKSRNLRLLLFSIGSFVSQRISWGPPIRQGSKTSLETSTNSTEEWIVVSGIFQKEEPLTSNFIMFASVAGHHYPVVSCLKWHFKSRRDFLKCVAHLYRKTISSRGLVSSLFVSMTLMVWKVIWGDCRGSSQLQSIHVRLL